VDEKRFKERPGSLYFTTGYNNLINGSKRLLPVEDLFLKGSKISG
jgi:hypothetical protein